MYCYVSATIKTQVWFFKNVFIKTDSYKLWMKLVLPFKKVWGYSSKKKISIIIFLMISSYFLNEKIDK